MSLTIADNSAFDSSIFLQRVSNAREVIAKVLEHGKYSTVLPSDISHTYNDKYLLSEYITSANIVSHVASLEFLGVTVDILKKLKEWSKIHSVTLRFTSEQSISFIKEESREVESSTVETNIGTPIGSAKIKSKSITKITEYFWNFRYAYKLLAYRGAQLEEIVISEGSRGCELKTKENSPPKKNTINGPFDLNISWLLGKYIFELNILQN